MAFDYSGIIPAVVSAWTGYKQAQREREYSSEMAGNRYQIAVADMKAAGLNPALMFGRGAPAPMAAGEFPNPAGELTQAVVGGRRLALEAELMKAQAYSLRTNADASSVNAAANMMNAQRGVDEYNFEYLGGEGYPPGKGYRGAEVAAKVSEAGARVGFYGKQSEVLSAQVKEIGQRVNESSSREDLNRLQGRLAELAVPRAEWTASQWDEANKALQEFESRNPRTGFVLRMMILSGSSMSDALSKVLGAGAKFIPY